MSPDAPLPRVHTIPAGVPFVDALARGLRLRAGEEPTALAGVTVLLPTRRAGRSLREAFLRQSGGRPLLLPRLLTLGDDDEDDVVLSGADGAGLAVPPALPPLRRQVLLTRLVMALPDRPASADQGAMLAAELARFLDQVHTEGLDFAALAGLVPEDFAAHWQITLDFLKVLTEQWPAVLAAEGGIDAADRRNRLLAMRAAAWRAAPPAAPVVAAGLIGSIPAAAELVEVVARLPQGLVVLPGLDTEADARTWEALEPSHPQWGLKRLLERLGLDRADVTPWPAPVDSRTPPSRAALVGRALRPAATTDGWRFGPMPGPHALDGVSRVDCPGPREEAGVIALILRQALEVEGRTAALVTPDRALARRVAAELARWGIAVDDSAGRPLADTPPGTFLRLVARAAAERLAPVSLLAVGKHPLAAGGWAAADFRDAVRHLERKVLRGPRPAPGPEGLSAAFGEGGPPPLARRLAAVFGRLEALLRADSVPAPDLLRAHVAAAEALAATDREKGCERLWRGEAGEAAAAFVSELADSLDLLGDIPGRAWPALFDALMAGRAVRPRFGRHPRLAIWGTLEARLQHADVMVLGGLNEGTWPPEAPASPWMSRPMLFAFGLPQPEVRIGQAAHDFVQAFCAPTVVLTRSHRVEGTPAVPSRWLLRLETLVRGTPFEGALVPATPWLALYGRLDAPPAFARPEAPAPTPPVAARPRELPVTQIETWMRDPYALYARRVLGLKALEPLDADPGAADYGIVIHRALEDFARAYPAALPDDAEAALLGLGERAFGAALDRPGVWAFWWPRFRAIAAWVVAEERRRRDEVSAVVGEVGGALTIEAAAGPFRLTAKADRIEVLRDGTLRLVDYKTGAPPTPKTVAAGYAPQLPLEAAIAVAGGFEGVAAAPVSALEFWRLRGDAAGGEVKPAGPDPAKLAAEALEGLTRLVSEFDFADTPYRARPRPDMAPRYSDYEHLARVKEWAAGDDD